MALPPNTAAMPGHDAIKGINATTDPELAKTASELVAWIEYLLHPESNDGPRLYRDRFKGPTGEPVPDAEFYQRNEHLDSQSHQYTAHSVLEGYEDIKRFFYAAEAVSGIDENLIQATYQKLAEGCFTWDLQDDKDVKGDSPERIADVPYPELHPARLNWMQMRKSWQGDLDTRAHEYEGDYIRFATYTENCLYILAEYLAKYRAIFQKAAEDVNALMKGLMEQFEQSTKFRGGGGLTFDWKSIIITGLVAAVSTVLAPGATAALALRMVAVNVIGEAVKTGKAAEHKLGGQQYTRDVARQYLEAVDKIGAETVAAVTELAQAMRRAVNEVRDKREYQVKPTDGDKKSIYVPFYRDYL